MSKEELKNNPEKLKELVRNDSNTDRSTKPVATAPTSIAPKRVNAKCALQLHNQQQLLQTMLMI